MDYKTCGKCHETKPISEFHKDKTRKDGVNPFCAVCKTNYTKVYYELHKEERKRVQNAYYKKNRTEILLKYKTGVYA